MLSGVIEGLDLKLWDETKTAEFVGLSRYNGIVIQKQLNKTNQQETTIPHSQIGKNHLLLRTQFKALFINIPENKNIRINKLLGRQIRVVDAQNKPVKVFIEVYMNNCVIQSGYTDVLGMFKVGKGQFVKVWNG